MELRFPESEIRDLAARYDAEQGERDRRLTKAITQDVFPSYRKKGYLTKEEFLTVCAWKTPRSQPRCASNDATFIKELSALVLTTASEHLRIQAWTLLAGVKWPTASVFLHFAFPNKYPIMDFRALWSLKTDVPAQYTFPFWQEYTDVCRALARKSGVTMRILDQALWKYSEINQG
ncbi:MAG TPA: hypothetical protein PLV50_15080 [Smithella sp.]|nr:hypothetical protein [Smithella sp.]